MTIWFCSGNYQITLHQKNPPAPSSYTTLETYAQQLNVVLNFLNSDTRFSKALGGREWVGGGGGGGGRILHVF